MNQIRWRSAARRLAPLLGVVGMTVLPVPIGDRSAAIALNRWARSGFTMPAPALVKRSVLKRHGIPGAPWIESGTYLGTTTAFLATLTSRVISLEPMEDLARAAQHRFRGDRDIVVIHGRSEDHLARLLGELQGDVNLWLDGHRSGGDVETYRGSMDTPVLLELEAVRSRLDGSRRMSVLVDDVRLFVAEHREFPDEPERPGYPSLSLLARWADENAFSWTIEHDILIMRNW